MVRVLVFGSFDLLHKGHYNFFKSAKELGDELYVVVARDSTIRDFKKHEPKYDEEERVRQVQEINYVDRAVLGNEDDKFVIIEDIKPDIIALGYDQESCFSDRLNDELNDRDLDVKIVRLQSYNPKIYKSSLLKENI